MAKRKKIIPGDGSALRPVRGLGAFWRSQFWTPLVETAPDGTQAEHTYAVDVDFFQWETTAALYRDGLQQAKAELPAAFPVPGGQIEVAAGTFGVTRMHLVDASGAHQLRPANGTAEYWRARFGLRHPVLSRLIGATAVAVLLVSLVLLVPQLIEQLSQIPLVADAFGTFTSPIQLPPWLNTTLTIAGVLAAIERALTLKNHWLIDAETWWFDD